MFDAVVSTQAVKDALNARADALEAQALQLRTDDHSARANVGSPAMLVFIKEQVAQEFRSLSEQINAL